MKQDQFIDKNRLVKYHGRYVHEYGQEGFDERRAHVVSTAPNLLRLLRTYKVKTTFFVTGRLFDLNPEVIQSMHDDGHEIAWHGHFHRPLLDEKTLLEDLDASQLFRSLYKPKGFRAPWLRFNENLLPILADAGIEYDSSCYGPAGTIYERSGIKIVPVTGIPLCGASMPRYGSLFEKGIIPTMIPIGSNFFIFLFGNNYERYIRTVQKKNKGCVIYLHNWQVFPWPERELTLLNDKLRYFQRYPFQETLHYLFSKASFCRMDALLDGTSSVFSGNCLSFDIE